PARISASLWPRVRFLGPARRGPHAGLRVARSPQPRWAGRTVEAAHSAETSCGWRCLAQLGGAFAVADVFSRICCGSGKVRTDSFTHPLRPRPGQRNGLLFRCAEVWTSL